ncbi:MAG TPA: helix-turn-helix domain-containing protein [Aliidongia sp.]|uniref:helix-turn-helix domain-containing protein n=1 Tax=Aliidongia sp. TaxID=1914230 RepID=UPI002DDDB88F|nr:helix-turn-helix domain-containing protein [Aliidongia sp.]HEV2673060.1 helix-turn-helix domain-containing protein [Aliidongia sp.]
MDHSLFESLAAVASQINASSDLDQTLLHLLEAVCRRPPWAAGGIMSIDTDRGYAQTVARHDPDRLGGNLETLWPLVESPTRIAIERNEPVIIRDAQLSQEFPGYHREALEHGYRGVIILPMDYRSRAGHRIVLSVRSREAVDVTPDELAFLQFVVHLGQIAMDKARSLAEEQAFGERLRGVLSAHGALLDQVLGDGSVAAAATMVASLLPNPPVIVDLTARRVMSVRSSLPTLVDDDAWQAAIADDLGGQFLEIAGRSDHRHRFDTQELELSIHGRVIKVPAICCPLTVDRTRVGALIVLSPTPESSDLDHLLLDSARFGLSVQMMRSYVAFVTEARNLEDLFADLLDGTRPLADIDERAERLNIDLAKPAHLLVATSDTKLPVGAAQELRRNLTHIVERLDARATVALRAGAVVIRCPVDRKQGHGLANLTQRVIAEMRAVTGATPVVVVSKICRHPADYLPAWRECERLRALAIRFGRSGPVTTEDFGPFPALMSAVDSDEMRGFVDRMIGAVTKHDAAYGTVYLKTLSAFLDHGCRSQPCADALGIHVTTLRYRLGRLKDLFDVTTDTPDQRFALQLALQFHRVLISPPPGVVQ